MSNAVWLA